MDKSIENLKRTVEDNSERISSMEEGQEHLMDAIESTKDEVRSVKEVMESHIEEENDHTKTLKDLIKIFDETKQGFILLGKIQTKIINPTAKFLAAIALLIGFIWAFMQSAWEHVKEHL
jgi:chromosome segregation ATPase